MRYDGLVISERWLHTIQDTPEPHFFLCVPLCSSVFLCVPLYVRAGDLVLPRQMIAAVGSTGRSTGPHLHFEVIRNGKRVEPGQVLAGVLARNSN